MHVSKLVHLQVAENFIYSIQRDGRLIQYTETLTIAVSDTSSTCWTAGSFPRHFTPRLPTAVVM